MSRGGGVVSYLPPVELTLLEWRAVIGAGRKMNAKSRSNVMKCLVILCGVFLLSCGGVWGTEPCVFTLSPDRLEHGSGSETGKVSVATLAGCAWAVQNTNTWVTVLSSLNNTDGGEATYRVALNPRTVRRSGMLKIGGQVFEVSQAAAANAIQADSPVDLGVVVVPAIGYELDSPRPGPGDVRWTNVWELLIDQDQSSGGGGTLAPIAVNWDTNVQFTLKIAAPPGQRFRVKVPAGKTAHFEGYLVWQSRLGDNNTVGGQATLAFGGLEGTPPSFENYSVLPPSQSIFGFWVIVTPPFTGEFSFSSMTFTGTVESRYMGYESQNFIGQPASSLQVVHSATDMSRYVSLVPEPAPPKISVTSASLASGTTLLVQGRALRKHVVEASVDLVHWTPISTNTLPATVCPTCPMAIVQDALGGNSGWRFYRVFELRQ